MFNPNKSFYSFIFILLFFVSLLNFINVNKVEIPAGAIFRSSEEILVPE